jgi:hypothetical protein
VPAEGITTTTNLALLSHARKDGPQGRGYSGQSFIKHALDGAQEGTFYCSKRLRISWMRVWSFPKCEPGQ